MRGPAPVASSVPTPQQRLAPTTQHTKGTRDLPEGSWQGTSGLYLQQGRSEMLFYPCSTSGKCWLLCKVLGCHRKQNNGEDNAGLGTLLWGTGLPCSERSHNQSLGDKLNLK